MNVSSHESNNFFFWGNYVEKARFCSPIARQSLQSTNVRAYFVPKVSTFMTAGEYVWKRSGRPWPPIWQPMAVEWQVWTSAATDRMTWLNEHSVRVCDTAFLFWTAQGLRTGERLIRVQWAG